jgi:hypothetical protein
MIWRVPHWIGVALLHVARLLSWLLLPAKTDTRLWDRDLCRWGMHNDEYDHAPWPGDLRWKCRRCGREWTHPRMV